MADGWRCPECHLILAPDVREHRCDPPEASVTAQPYIGDPPGSCGTFTSTAALPGTVTVNVTGPVADDRALLGRLQVLQLQRANWRGGLMLPGRAA